LRIALSGKWVRRNTNGNIFSGDLKVGAKSWASLPRASARGLESENNLGVLTPEPGGLKPDRIGAPFSFQDLKAVAKSWAFLPPAYGLQQNRLTKDRGRGL